MSAKQEGLSTKLSGKQKALVEKVIALSGRIYIPPYTRIKGGNLENVDGYWRQVNSIRDLTPGELQAVYSAPGGGAIEKASDFGQGITPTLPRPRLLQGNPRLAEAYGVSLNRVSSSRGVGVVDIQTDVHRAVGSRGISVEVEDGKVTRWRLRDGGSWTTGDLRKAQQMYDDSRVRSDIPGVSDNTARFERRKPAKATGPVYTFDPVGLDIFDRRPNQPPAGTEVRLVQPPGTPKNGTMGHVFVEDANTGEFYGLVTKASLKKKSTPRGVSDNRSPAMQRLLDIPITSDPVGDLVRDDARTAAESLEIAAARSWAARNGRSFSSPEQMLMAYRQQRPRQGDSRLADAYGINLNQVPGRDQQRPGGFYREGGLLSQKNPDDAVAEQDLTPSGHRPIHRIYDDIVRDWPKVNYAAVPYLDAMRQLNDIKDNYYADSAASVVSYFLGNASSWRGEKAKEIKAELKQILKKA